MEFYVGLVMLVVAAGLLLRAVVRRRVGDVPYCRKCGFELSGLTEPGRCPECGRQLAHRGAIRVGEVRIRKRLMWVGVGFAVLGGACVGIDALNRNGKFNLTSVKPAWLLYAEAYLLDDSRASVATDEIVGRGQAMTLSAGWNSRLLRISLDRHSQRWRSFPYAQWGVILEGYSNQKLSKERIDQLIEDAIGPIDIERLGYQGSLLAGPGEMLEFDLIMNWRAGEDYDYYYNNLPSIELRVVEFELASEDLGVVLTDTNHDLEKYSSKSTDTGSIYRSSYSVDGVPTHDLLYGLPDDIEPGIYTATVTVHMYRVYTPDYSKPESQRLPWHRDNDSLRVLVHSFPVEIASVEASSPIAVVIGDLGEGVARDLIGFKVIDRDVIFGHTPIIEYEINIPSSQLGLSMVGDLVFTQSDREHWVKVRHDAWDGPNRERVLLPRYEPGEIQIRYEHDAALARHMRHKIDRVLVGTFDLGTYTMPSYQQTLDAQGPGR